MKPILDPQDEAIWTSRCWLPSGKGSKYFKASINGQMVYLHRVIVGATGTQLVDHINGNPLDNRRCNLRLCDRAQSNANRKRKATSRAPYKGISRTPSGRWLAQIMWHKRYERIGLFDSPEQAAAAYDERAKVLHGEFARVNGLAS